MSWYLYTQLYGAERGSERDDAKPGLSSTRSTRSPTSRSVRIESPTLASAYRTRDSTLRPSCSRPPARQGLTPWDFSSPPCLEKPWNSKRLAISSGWRQNERTALLWAARVSNPAPWGLKAQVGATPPVSPSCTRLRFRSSSAVARELSRRGCNRMQRTASQLLGRGWPPGCRCD
jgi:hypothetical protein